VFWSADHQSVETGNYSRIIIIKMDLETQGVLMWTGFISVQAQVRSCEYAEETLGSIHCEETASQTEGHSSSWNALHIIQNWGPCCLFVYRRIKLKWIRLQKLLSHYTHTHYIYIYIYIYIYKLVNDTYSTYRYMPNNRQRIILKIGAI